MNFPVQDINLLEMFHVEVNKRDINKPRGDILKRNHALRRSAFVDALPHGSDKLGALE